MENTCMCLCGPATCPDGNNWQANYANGLSVSKVSLTTFEEEKKIPVGLNPTKIVADASGNLIVLCMGDYTAANPASLWKINSSSDEASEMGIHATIMALRGNSLYVIYAPYNDPEAENPVEPTYIVYNTVTGAVENPNFVSTPVLSAAGITVHPESGNIYITSYGDKANYSVPSYVNAYTPDGTLTDTYDVGVGAVNMSFLD